MSRLPIVGGDLGGWGSILNDYLSQSLDATGGVTATGSTTSRTLPARFSGVYNVLDYGAKGDGTTNDAAAFQAAINAAQTGTKIGLVYVPPVATRYLLSSGLTFSVAGAAAPLSIAGDGKYTTIIRYTGAGSFLSATGGNGFIQGLFRDFTVQLTNAAAIGLNMTQLESATVRSVRVAWVGVGSNGGTAIYSVPANVNNAPFFNVIDDFTSD